MDAGITASLLTGTVPAAAMLACTVLGLGIKVPHDIAGALQHFAAGLLLSAIGCELLPVLLKASGFMENFYATIGFFSGMAVLIILGAILPEHDDDDSDDDEPAGRTSSIINKRRSSMSESLQEIATGQKGLRSRTSSKLNIAKTINKEFCNNCETLLEQDEKDETTPLVVKSNSEKSQPSDAQLPLTFLAAIAVDAFMDGFLLGITGVAGKGAAIIMAGSLSVEMAFVGLTLATACHGMPYSKAIPAALTGPVVLLFGALVGGLVTGSIANDPALMAGIMGFGTSALLFMVAEELLLEAHEDDDCHVWWVDVQVYTGFYWGFMSTKFLPA